jgi:adenylate cyclase
MLLAELIERSKREEFGQFALALAYAGLGEEDSAFAAVHRAIDRRDIFMPEIFFDPLLHPLRDDPRFGRVLERMGLPRTGGSGEPSQ